MTNIKKLLKLDLKFLKNHYKAYILAALIMLFGFGNRVFNMGLLMLVFYYSLESDENYKKIDKNIKMFPINNKEYVAYKYMSSFMQLIFIIIMFLVASIIILMAQKISNSDSQIFLLSWISNHIVEENAIQSNYFIRAVLELFMAIVTICMMIPTKYNTNKKKRVFIWLILIFINSMVGSCLAKDYTWVIFDFIGKFNEIFIVVLAAVLSYLFIKLSYNKTLQLYSKSEIS